MEVIVSEEECSSYTRRLERLKKVSFLNERIAPPMKYPDPVETLDWSDTPLGDRLRWPSSLVMAVSLCQGLEFPALLIWGSKRYIVYNAAWLAYLPAKAHDLVGYPLSDLWPEGEEIIRGLALALKEKPAGMEAVLSIPFFGNGEPAPFHVTLLKQDDHKEDSFLFTSMPQHLILTAEEEDRANIEKRTNSVNAARLHLMQFAVTHSLDQLLEETLNEVEKLTGSKIGFFHFVEDDQRTLSLQEWSTRTKKEFCLVQGKGVHYPIHQAGVWVECVYTRKPVTHNDYMSLPCKKGMPDGHAKVVRELVVPVIRGNKIRAILGTGNKESDYNEADVDTVALFADLAWEIAEKKMMDDELTISSHRYETLFFESPVALREEDFTDLVGYINQVVRESSSDIRTYLDAHPEKLVELAKMVKIVDVNQATMALFGASCKNEFMKNFTSIFTEQSYSVFKEEVIAIVDGKFEFESEVEFQTLQGELKEIYLKLSIDWTQSHTYRGLIATFDITKRKQDERNLQRLNRELRAISNCNQTLLRAENTQSLLDEICRIICDDAGYRMSWVGYANDDTAHSIYPVAAAGVEDGYLQSVRFFWDSGETMRSAPGEAIRTGTVSVVQDFATDPDVELWREKALARGYRSKLVLPLKNEKELTFGVLAIYSSEPNAFDQSEKRLLEDLAGDLAYGITALRIKNERKETQKALRKMNETLEQRVQEELTKNREKDHLLIQQSRLATMGEMMRNVAHQWRQPLNTLNIIFENILDEYKSRDLTEAALDHWVSDGNRLIRKMSDTIDDFRTFFQPDSRMIFFPLHEALNETLLLLEASLENDRISVTVHADEEVRVMGYPNEFSHVLLNIISNAQDAIRGNGIKDGLIEVYIQHDFSKRSVMMIYNNGGRIDEQILPRIFDPYFTTKERGIGVGLYMSRKIMEHMHGSLSAKNTKEGVEFQIVVPAD